MSLIEIQTERHSNPVDMIEFVAASNDWTFERSGEDEIASLVFRPALWSARALSRRVVADEQGAESHARADT